MGKLSGSHIGALPVVGVDVISEPLLPPEHPELRKNGPVASVYGGSTEICFSLTGLGKDHRPS